MIENFPPRPPPPPPLPNAAWTPWPPTPPQPPPHRHTITPHTHHHHHLYTHIHAYIHAYIHTQTKATKKMCLKFSVIYGDSSYFYPFVSYQVTRLYLFYETIDLIIHTLITKCARKVISLIRPAVCIKIDDSKRCFSFFEKLTHLILHSRLFFS